MAKPILPPRKEAELWHKAHGREYAGKPVDSKDRKLMRMAEKAVATKKESRNA